MKKALLTDDECWLRVQARDASADGRFVFAVRTTGVFCRPSCRSKRALRKNVRFFANAEQALDAGFRPCKRCQPDNARAQQRRLDKIACACRLLEQETPVTLASLAQAVAMSPFHLHRLFKVSTGMTPKGWQQAWRARRLREALAKGEPITAAIYRAGFPDSSSYYRHADQTLGMTAKQFRKGGDNVSVRYALTDWVYGRCLVAESERGICAILPGDSDDALLAELHTLFPTAPRTCRRVFSATGAAGCRGYQHTRCAALVAAGYPGNRVSTAGLAGVMRNSLRRNRKLSTACRDYRQTHGGTRGRQRVRRE